MSYVLNYLLDNPLEIRSVLLFSKLRLLDYHAGFPESPTSHRM